VDERPDGPDHDDSWRVAGRCDAAKRYQCVQTGRVAFGLGSGAQRSRDVAASRSVSRGFLPLEDWIPGTKSNASAENEGRSFFQDHSSIARSFNSLQSTTSEIVFFAE
jgi:hypothetical protein